MKVLTKEDVFRRRQLQSNGQPYAEVILAETVREILQDLIDTHKCDEGCSGGSQIVEKHETISIADLKRSFGVLFKDEVKTK